MQGHALPLFHKSTPMLTDAHQRTHNYLRISLTDNCDLRCFYCMPEEDHHFTPHARLMQTDEVVELAKVFVAQGVDKIRLTGGEPLVRKDAPKIIAALSKLPAKLLLTTNGTRVKDLLPSLLDSSIRSINVSLDTLRPERFFEMTRRDRFALVREGIELLLANHFHVKVNMVVIQDMNDDEILDFVAWTRHVPIHVRFIEFMPFSGNRWSSNKVFSYQQILERIATEYPFEPLPALRNDTAKAFHVPSHEGTFAVISTMTAPFCAGCNRIRLTADGKLKNCLFSKGETDLLTPLRAGMDILPLIEANIKSKEKELGGQFSANNFEQLMASDLDNRSMIAIGG
jgi:GTP 3',8-cyclase